MHARQVWLMEKAFKMGEDKRLHFGSGDHENTQKEAAHMQVSRMQRW